jgi:hypothetical protein
MFIIVTVIFCVQQGAQRPQSWLAKTAARVVASVGIELASVGGYTQEIRQYHGVAKLVKVKLDAVGHSYFWIGAFNKYHFVGSREDA